MLGDALVLVMIILSVLLIGAVLRHLWAGFAVPPARPVRRAGVRN